jgi:hypothetical protein
MVFRLIFAFRLSIKQTHWPGKSSEWDKIKVARQRGLNSSPAFVYD